MHITDVGKFIFSMSENNIWILRKDIDKTELKEYGLDESNGLLFFNNEFCGIDTIWYKPDGTINYPPNNGAVPETEVATLPQEQSI